MTTDLIGFENTKYMKKEKRAAIVCSYSLKISSRVLPRAAGALVLVAEEEKLKGLSRGNLVWILGTILSSALAA